MKKNKLLLILLALIAFAQGAWAQNTLEEEWQEVLAMTQTTSSNWNVLHSGSTTGHWFGSDGNTTYYRLGLNNNIYNFTNYQHDGSGATVHGTVYLYVPTGITVNFIGANANGANGAGAGIELPEGNTLRPMTLYALFQDASEAIAPVEAPVAEVETEPVTETTEGA